MNSWLPHSFGKNPSDDNFRFIHFNISVFYNPTQPSAVVSEATVI